MSTATMTTLPSYPKIWQFGAIPLIDGPDNRPYAAGDCLVQEKVDGSQISFGKIDGEIQIRSKNSSAFDNSMFAAGVEQIMARANVLPEGVIYRGEYLKSPKHNTLTYNRTPIDHIVLFDCFYVFANAWSHGVDLEAARLGFESVPVLHKGRIDKEMFEKLLDTQSFLGGCKIEGFVVKRYDLLTKLHQPAFCKFVSADFKEQHTKSWKQSNPNATEFAEQLGAEFANPARFRKAVERARDAGTLTGSAADIGMLFKDLSVDFEIEWREHCEQKLYLHYRKAIMNHANRGFAEWYKEQLAEGALQ